MQVAAVNQLTLEARFSSLFNAPQEESNQDCSDQYEHPSDYDKFPVDKKQRVCKKSTEVAILNKYKRCKNSIISLLTQIRYCSYHHW
jgi:hypothetical protein